MKEFFLVLIGGICSVLGGCIAIWYQAKKARQIRMEEVRGEQGLEACKKALFLTGQLRILSIQDTDKAIQFLDANSEWFSMNQILLPHKFVENWISIRSLLESVKDNKEDLQKRISDEVERQNKIKENSRLRGFIRQLIDEMGKVIRKELGLEEIKIRTPDSENKQ